MTEPPPAPFQALANFADRPDDLRKAELLSEALLAVPDLQSWLREQRRLTVRALKDQDVSVKEIAARLDITEQRVYDIASGHSRSRAPRRAKP